MILAAAVKDQMSFAFVELPVARSLTFTGFECEECLQLKAQVPSTYLSHTEIR